MIFELLISSQKEIVSFPFVVRSFRIFINIWSKASNGGQKSIISVIRIVK